jgi:hypothetical protein
MEKIHRRSKGGTLGAIHKGMTLDQRMKQSCGLAEIRGIEFDLTKGRERVDYSRMQQGRISYALQAAATSGDNPLVHLIDANEQTTDNISSVPHWLSHGLETGQFFEQRFILVDQLIHKVVCTLLKRFRPRTLLHNMRHVLADLAAVQPDLHRCRHKCIKLVLTDVLSFDLQRHVVW